VEQTNDVIITGRIYRQLLGMPIDISPAFFNYFSIYYLQHVCMSILLPAALSFANWGGPVGLMRTWLVSGIVWLLIQHLLEALLM
jgi:hypothetical protein